MSQIPQAHAQGTNTKINQSHAAGLRKTGLPCRLNNNLKSMTADRAGGWPDCLLGILGERLGKDPRQAREGSVHQMSGVAQKSPFSFLTPLPSSWCRGDRGCCIGASSNSTIRVQRPFSGLASNPLFFSYLNPIGLFLMSLAPLGS